MQFFEVNFDGMPGMTHLFSGLSAGNLASENNKGQLSFPKKAALQSLEKMNLVYKLGIQQAFIPPQPKPIKHFLETNTRAALASSNMWTANAATISPSPDSQDSKLHITVANLAANFHRSLEASYTETYLRQVFADEKHFSVHPPLANELQDEGAANHSRLCPEYNKEGLEFFVYNYDLAGKDDKPQKFPGRQTKEACIKQIEDHRLEPANVLLAQQNPVAVDQGVFHNDVISTVNKDHFLYHQNSFAKQNQVLENLQEKFQQKYSQNLICIEISEEDFSVKDAVESYFFNSQLLSLTEDMLLLAPLESQQNTRVKAFIDKILIDNSNKINQVKFIDLKQSMCNGGGPACLRLRVVMSEAEISAAHPKVFFDETLYQNLGAWVEKFYPDSLNLDQALDPAFHKQIEKAYIELFSFLELKF